MADGGSREVEWQFDAPDLEAVERWLRAQPAHAALTLEERPVRQQRDTYFDTAEWHLFQAGYSLRVRVVGDRSETTLKGLPAGDDGPLSRTELSEPGDLAGAAASASPVGERLRLMLRGQTARPLFTVATTRRVWLVRSAEAVLAEIALDDTSIELPGGAVTPLRRVEVEEVASGGLTRIEPLVAAIREECGLTAAPLSKFASGLAAAGRQPGPPDLGATTITPDDRLVDRAYAVLRRRAAELLARESGTALGEDVEQLHDMRVATRRLRAALRGFDTVLPPALLEARDELRWFAQALGAVRDLDVQLADLRQLRGSAAWAESTALAPLAAQFERQHGEARDALLIAMDSERYTRLTGVLRTALIAGPPADALATTSREEGRRIVLRRARRFEAAARALRRDSPRPQFHALRILGKRLRYSLEFFVDLYGRPGQRALVSLRGVQDLLGELQDLATTDLRLRDMVRDLPGALPADTLVMVGRLMERHEDRSEAIVRSFPRSRAAVLGDFKRLRRLLRAPEAHADDPPPEADPPAPVMGAAVTVLPPRPRPPASASLSPGETLRSFIRFFRSRR